MCGIAGLFGFQDQTIDPKQLEVMNLQLIHRGPDADGFYTHRHVGLCMRRLKVIDLSTGNQPIHNEDKTLWIVFNGEIYNYKELREDLLKKGHKFYTHSDTEVIVHLYQEYGDACVNHLIGMFAFAIYNTKQDELFIARDRLGVKPLFYQETAEGVSFASELKPLLKSPWVKKELDPQAVSHFLSLNYLPDPWTPFKGICQLAPGHWMKISKGSVKTQLYWDVPFGETIEVSEEEACKKILELMHRSMERRLIADVPIGAFLSGGLDSSTLVYLMKEHRHEKIKTFSVGFDDPDYDETPYAREVAEFYGTEHYEVRCKPEHVQEYFPKIAWHADNLLADQAALPLYAVSKLAKEHVTVCLSGDGGDEIFVGYPTFEADRHHRLYSKVPSFLRRGFVEPLVGMIPSTTQKVGFDYKAKKFVQAGSFSPEKAHYWWRTIFTDREKEELLVPGFRSQIPSLDAYPLYGKAFDNAKSADFVTRCLYADLKVWLSGNNLNKVDTMSMAHGLEARVPLLDHELVEYMLKLPPSLKFRNNVLKYLLKKIMADKLPPRIMQRKKAGFHSPIAGWLKKELREFASSSLVKNRKIMGPVFQLETVWKILDEHCEGKANNSFKIWGLLTFNSWMGHFDDGR